MEKYLFIPPIHSCDTANFRVPPTEWSHPFLIMPKQIILNFQKLLEIVELKSMQSDWSETKFFVNLGFMQNYIK